MPKYLFQATYTAEGIKGLEKDKAAGRKAALSKAVESLGGQTGSLILGFRRARLGFGRGPARQCQRHGFFVCGVWVRPPSGWYDPSRNSGGNRRGVPEESQFPGSTPLHRRLI
jgi:hypothetical protein